MTLLDRFRTTSRHKHPDAAVRLAYVAEIPLTDRDTIASMAREDADVRVRRAAVAKLLDPGALGGILRADSDQAVRGAAVEMLRDISMEAFEGIGEAEALDAVDALDDGPALSQIAKGAPREIVALRALSRVADVRYLGTVAKHAGAEAVRRGALVLLRDRGDAAEILAVALNAEHKDVAVAAVELIEAVGDRPMLEQVAARSRSKAAVRRARASLRARDEAEGVAVAVTETEEPEASSAAERAAEQAARAAEQEAAERARVEAAREAAEQESAEQAAARAAAAAETAGREEANRVAAEREAEHRRTRMQAIVEELERAAGDRDFSDARKRVRLAKSEWERLVQSANPDGALVERVAAADAAWIAREETDTRVRRDALARLERLLGRVEALAGDPNLTMKAADHAAREIRSALGNTPPLPSREVFQDVIRRLKAAQSSLEPKIEALREAEDWQRWANVTTQEQLCAKMEGLQAQEDPEQMAHAVRELQSQWRLAADVPRAQADALWQRFKTAHDMVWPRCEAHLAARAESLRANLERKVALCEKAEALADSGHWLQTAEEIKRLQTEWKTIGAVPKGQEKAIWDRFRLPCDRFFTRRNEDLTRRKAVWAENLAKKIALCEKAEALAASTDWDPAAAAIKQLQAEWKTIGSVKKSRSEAIWQRFRAACDLFFANYAQRHTRARAERVAEGEAVCVELERLAAEAAADAVAADLLSDVRKLQTRWKQNATDVRPGDLQELDERFTKALGDVAARWPDVFRRSDLDPAANRARMDELVARVEDLARSFAGQGGASKTDEALSPATRLATMLKEALAANTIGGSVSEQTRTTAAVEEVRQAQASWTRIGPVSHSVRQPLQDRFQRACRAVLDRAAAAGRSGRPDGRTAAPRPGGKPGR